MSVETRSQQRAGSSVDPADPARGEGVRAMFADISPRYDLLNRILSFGRDQAWRRRAVRMARLTGGERVLDLCCGTGDLALIFQRLARPRRRPSLVVGADFTPEMLRIARRKSVAQAARRGMEVLRFVVADAHGLPFPDGAFDVVSIGYGLRNLEDLDRGLREMARVLRPGGRLTVLECTPATGPLGRVANWYINRVVPALGQALSRSRSRAYSYLAESIQLFPDADELAIRMEDAGFGEVSYRLLNFGTMAIHIGTKTRATDKHS